MGRRLEYEVKTSVRLNMSNPQHVKINDVIQNLDPKIFKSKNQFIIDAIQFYIDNYGKETFVIKKKEKERAEYIRSEDIDDIKEEVIEAATNEARKEVIKLLGGVISGIGLLMGRYRALGMRGKCVQVVNVNSHIAKLLRLSGVGKYIEICGIKKSAGEQEGVYDGKHK